MHLGKGKHAIYLAVFLLFSASAGGQAGKNFRYHFDGGNEIANVITGSQSLTINYSLSELNLGNTTNTTGTFYRVTIPGHTPTVEPGKPELPVYSRLITVPAGSEFKIKISEVKSSKLKPSGKKIDGILFPAQEGMTKSFQQNKPEFRIDKASYSEKKLISSDTVVIERIGSIRNKNIANLRITPVRYNPHSNTLEVITSMKIEILFSESEKSVSRSQVSESALFSQSLEKGVVNYNPDEVVPGFSDRPVKMVIITDTAFRKHLQPFLKWKMQEGYELNVLYKGLGKVGTTYLQLKDTLTKIYLSADAANPPPEYLLIIGDVNRIPYYGQGGSGNITDMYYGEFDGNGDYIPEMYVGRLPVADTTELKNVVQKIIQYEKFEFAESNKFYSGAIGAAGSDAGYATYMNGQLKYLTTNYLTAANKITNSHFYYPSTLTAEKDSIIKLINKGTSFINYTGHGDVSIWLHLGFQVADTAKLHNVNMYPLIISNACQTARFSSKYSLGNRMVVSGKKGAIGFIGCSNDSYWDEDYYWSTGPGNISENRAYDPNGLGAFDRLFHTHAESPSDWYFTLGQINYAGNMAVSASTTSRKKYYWETYNVIGDPSMIPIIGTPLPFNAVLPDTLPNGIKSLSLDLDPFSYVAISHFDKLWDASYVSKSGSVVLDLPGVSEDSCLIVITGQNKIPVIKTVYISEVKKEFLNLTSTAISDLQGNNNARADFGEAVSLNLKVGNLGLTAAQNVYAKISSKSGYITISADSVFIGTINANSEALITDKLAFTVAGNVPDLSVATLLLKIKDSKTEKLYSVDVTIHAPDLLITSCIMDDTTLGDGDYIADPGETFNLVFKIKNEGSSDASGQFFITSPMGEITILQPSVKSGLLKFGETTDIPITVKLSESAPSGTVITVYSTLNCSPFIINKDFTFRAGRIRESFEASSFNIFPWINISSIPWTLSESGSYDGGTSAKSGAILHNQSTTLSIKTQYREADSLKFYYKVSSEANYDYLSFIVNGTEVFKKSGDIPWTRAEIALPAGLNKLEWKYKKDQSVSGGSDCAWIDMIDFAVNGTVSYIQKDLKIAKIIGPVQKDDFGREEVTVKVLNTGRDILNGFNLAYSVNGHQPVKEFFDKQVIPDGDTVTVSFTSKADLSKYGIYDFKIYGIDNKDDYLNNDTLYVKVENTKITETLSAFPNPFREQLTVVLNSVLSDKVIITLVSASGVKIQIFEKVIISGMNTIVLPFPDLAPSLYYLNIRGTTIDKTIPVMKITR